MNNFDERKQKFLKELNKLLEKYNFYLSVNILPENKFAKIFKKFIKVRWNFIVIDYGIQQPETLSSKQPDNK
ncbi:MAG: hypothetical protein QW469_00475 [Candidatus Aenigmatarchaeota archaeon]